MFDYDIEIDIFRIHEGNSVFSGSSFILYLDTIYIILMDPQKILSKVDGFDWDEHNVLKNWDKHKITNWECEEIFFNKPLIIRFDQEHSLSEARYYALGQSDKSIELFVVFTIRDHLIRPISFRKMTRGEKKVYEHDKKK